MAMKAMAYSFFFFMILLCYSSLSVSSAAIDASSPSDNNNITSSSNICESTPDPKFCRSVLPSQPANLYYYGRFSVRKSLSQSRKFLRLVDRYLMERRRTRLSKSAIGALEDCRLLAGLTMDYLLDAYQTVNATSKTLPVTIADDIQTFLSAALTNEQTCIDGLKSATWTDGVNGTVASDLRNDTKLYSVSLALFSKGWVPKKKKARVGSGSGSGFGFAHRMTSSHKHFRGFRNGALPLKLTERANAVYQTLTRRKLADGEADPVLVSDVVTVSQDGTGNFTTINDAVAAAPNNTAAGNGYFMIYVMEGVYEEYVSIAKNKKYLMMIGDGINRTVITGNRSVVDGSTTFNSATFAVVAPNFVAVNITFRNTAGPEKHQAVAVRSGADLSIFYSCSFEAYQDTLYTHSLRQFYRECDIYGTVDFIFGNAAVVLQACNLYPRKAMKGQFNAITAQGRTDPNQNTGTSIHNCTIKPADDLVNSNYTVKTYLGRPWKEYSRTVYMQTDMASFIEPEGWRAWDKDFALNTLYYAEFNNTGPGSNTTNRVTWTGYHVINATDAANFTVSGFLLGDSWVTDTGVPFVSGLIEPEI